MSTTIQRTANQREESWREHVLVGLLGIATLYVGHAWLTYFYNIFLHPLKHLEGPPLARMSTIWGKVGRFYACKSDRIHDAHIKYGPVVRIGPNEVSFADPRAVRQTYESNDFVKEHDFYWAKRIAHEDHVMTIRDPVAHRKRRKLLSRGFSQASMLEFEPTLSSKIQIMLDHWARISHHGGSIDAYAWTHWLAFDTVYHLMFDEDPGSVAAGKPAELISYLSARKPTETYKILVPSLEQWGRYLPGPVGDSFRTVFGWKAIAVAVVQRCRKEQVTTPFLRSVLSGEKDDFLGRELTDSELATECMGGMAGGSGTTANSFIYVLWACLRDERVATKLRKELREAFPANDRQTVPEYSICQALPYLQAVINETLRLYPTIIATLPRTALKDTTVAGVHIPAGTIVGTQNRTLHQDAVAFPHPTQFQPERWLGQEATTNASMKAAWNPFSTGSRKCIGINLALMELSKLVAAFFLRFEAAEIDPMMEEKDMHMYDTFNAGPVGKKLVIRVKEA